MTDAQPRSASAVSGTADTLKIRPEMHVRPLKLQGSYEIVLYPHKDVRGYFLLTYDEDFFRGNGLVTEWIQENQTLTRRMGVIRGLHFQAAPHWQTRLVRVVVGKVWYVIVDLLSDSPTRGQWNAIELSEANHKLLYIPTGFAHGFCTLSALSLVQYKLDARHVPEAEGGIRWDDETLGIPWPAVIPLVSERDRSLPSFASLKTRF